MDIRPIKTDADYHRTVREIETLMTAEPGTEAGDRLDVLVALVEAFERSHFPMDLPDAVDAIKFRMGQQGLTVDDLVPAIVRKNRVYEVLARVEQGVRYPCGKPTQPTCLAADRIIDRGSTDAQSTSRGRLRPGGSSVAAYGPGHDHRRHTLRVSGHRLRGAPSSRPDYI